MHPATLCDLAARLGVAESDLRRLIENAESLYTVRRRRKVSGRVRVLHVPAEELRTVQRRLSAHLLMGIRVASAAHGFVRGRSIADAARPHVGQRCVLHLDIADFFPSITSAMVRGTLRGEGFSEEAAEALTRLTTLRGRLPQGAPTSPALSNLVFRPLDHRLSALAKRRGIIFTRYADDLTFSGKGDTPGILPTVREILGEAGFRLRADKTRVQRRGRAQRVLGLTVNDGVGVARSLRRNLRAALHRAARQGGRPTTEQMARIEGMIAHIGSVSPAQAAPLRAALVRLKAESS
ncbi:RNA-directed DNA polymerase [Candidatus Sumerlaeota bacterium]|nr:RNA-directed DNA polymerase [Candidatus Sumerlaeota bacterium]